MQIRIFTIPIGESGELCNELNKFLQSHRILEVNSQLVNHGQGASWTFCVRYQGLASRADEKGKRIKVDYREILDQPTFERFAKLREIRKKVAAEEAISAYIVFTDEELAALARLDEITEESMLSIKGIGEKKIGRYARFFVSPNEQNETKRLPD